MYLYIWITQLRVHTLAEIFHVRNWAGVILMNDYMAPPLYLPKVLPQLSNLVSLTIWSYTVL